MNATITALLCVLLVILFLFSAYFSSSETALLSLSPAQRENIRKQSPEISKRLEELLHDPAILLSAILVGNNLVNFAIATIGYHLTREVCPGYAGIVSVVVVTILLLLFGEVTPKRFAITHQERLVPLFASTLPHLIRPIKPFSEFLKNATGAHPLIRKIFRSERRALNDSELMEIVEASKEQGNLDQEEVDMMDGVLRLSELRASDEMTPRIDIVGVDIDLPKEQQLAAIDASHFRYMPIFNRTADSIKGFLDVAQYLLDPDHDFSAASHNALFVPENITLDKLLLRFQSTGMKIACVSDEYGGTAGIITLGDILELVAEPVISHDRNDDPITDISIPGKRRWKVLGTTSLEEINRTTGLELVAHDADRISGWISFHAGKIPAQGTVVEAQDCRATVLKMRRRRITLVRIELTGEDNDSDLDIDIDGLPEVEAKDLLEDSKGVLA
ncbi:MAG: HlyC/CorC family transporter [Kiritimatiellae bacterium]|nr:HlyC/CorC family transporter [Kiritimatiellia bacterium]